MSQKIKVVQTPGGGALGLMDPQVGMVTTQGTVTAIHVNALGSGDVLTVQRAAGRVFYDYPLSLEITVANATGLGWPTGTDCVLYGHSLAVTEDFYTTAPNNLNGTFLPGNGKPLTFLLTGTSGTPVGPIIP